MSKKRIILIIVDLIIINILQIYVNLTYAENVGTTYYISAIGTSKEGTDINNPMSLKIANSKTYNGNDKVLFRAGDTFYGTINFNVKDEDGNVFYIGKYGDGEKPIISGANILINKEAWNLENGLYKIDLSDYDNFQGIGKTYWEPYNIGFLADENGHIYGDRKSCKDKIYNEFDFYCENNYLYIKCTSNPSDELGKIKFVSRNNLVNLSSNIILDGLEIEYTGAHGIVKKTDEIDNVTIENCIIQNIGGSVQVANTFTRYGNGIEFWNQGSNIVVKNNIFREIYDAGFTIQGNIVTTGFENVECANNIIEKCTYPIEISCRNKNNENIQIGINNCNIYNNIIINQGRGWGYSARPDKSPSSDLVVWNLEGKYANISMYNNIKYNSLNELYLYPNNLKLKTRFEKNVISDYNKIFMNKDSTLINSKGLYDNRSILKDYSAELNSQFNLIDTESQECKKILDIAAESNDINEIRSTVLYNTGILKKDATIKIKYVNSQDNTEVLSEKTISGLKLGTYGVVAREINGYKVIGNSSCVLTLNEEENSPEIIFKYSPENAANNSDTSMWTNGLNSNESDVKLISEENTNLEVPDDVKNEIEAIKNEKSKNIEIANEDNTVINSILPNTGKGIVMDLLITSILLIGIYSWIRYYRLKKQTYKQM